MKRDPQRDGTEDLTADTRGSWYYRDGFRIGGVIEEDETKQEEDDGRNKIQCKR